MTWDQYEALPKGAIPNPTCSHCESSPCLCSSEDVWERARTRAGAYRTAIRSKPKHQPQTKPSYQPLADLLEPIIKKHSTHA